MRPLRIAQVAPPLERVPPHEYGGTERVVFELVNELHRRGHELTLFASGDSEVDCRHIPTVPEALRPAGFGGDASPYFLTTLLDVLKHADEFDIIHSHLEWWSILLGRAAPVPVVSTFHGRMDEPASRELLADRPRGLVAISWSQASSHPLHPWTGVVHHGLSLANAPFDRRRGDDLCFVGRIQPEKGAVEAIDIARISGRRLVIAAKVGPQPEQQAYYNDVFRPALGRADVEFLGEISGHERDRLLARSYATLMPGTWPEPFGLVAIESLACGTPIVAHRVGAMPEIIREGIDGFFADDAQQMAFMLQYVDRLDGLAIRESALERFSVARMAAGYEAVYERMLRPAVEAEEPISSAPVTLQPPGERLARLRATAAVPPPQELRAAATSAPKAERAPEGPAPSPVVAPHAASSEPDHPSGKSPTSPIESSGTGGAPVSQRHR